MAVKFEEDKKLNRRKRHNRSKDHNRPKGQGDNMSKKQELIEALLNDRAGTATIIEQMELQLLTGERVGTNQWHQMQRQRNALLEYKNATVDRIYDLLQQQTQEAS